MPEENKVVVEMLDKITKSQDENSKASKKTSEEVKGLSDKIVESEKSSKEALEKVSSDVDEFKSEITNQLVEVKETGTHLEKAISRMGNGGGGTELSVVEQKAEQEFASLLRYSKPLSDETNEHIARSMVEKMFTGMTTERREIEIKELVAGINPQGGYWIRPERLAQVVSRIFETSPMRELANIVTTTSDVVQMIIDDNEFTSGGWVGELQDRDGTDTGDIGLLSIPVQEQFAQPSATQKMIDDAGFDIEGYIIGKITDILTRTENTSFVVGDGSQKPRGFLNYPNWLTFDNQGGTEATVLKEDYERGALEYRLIGTAGALSDNDIKGLQNSLKEAYQADAVWVMKRATFEQVITLKDKDDAYVFQSRFLENRDTPMLLSKRVVFMDDMPLFGDTTATQDATPFIAYGNFGIGYTIVDRLGIRVIRDEVTKKGKVLFYANKRVGGAVTNFESIKILFSAVDTDDLPVQGVGSAPAPLVAKAQSDSGKLAPESNKPAAKSSEKVSK